MDFFGLFWTFMYYGKLILLYWKKVLFHVSFIMHPGYTGVFIWGGQMNIVMLKTADLVPYENNPRDNADAVPYVMESIKQFGFKEDIAIVDNKYIVTTSGKVYTIYYNKRGIQEQKLRNHSNGYLRATIFGKDFYVHRLVAMCFIENPNNYNEISHEDNDKTNNCVDNLKWCTRQYNNKKMFTDGIKTPKDMQKMSLSEKAVQSRKSRRRFNSQQAAEIKKMINDGVSDTQIAIKFNCSRGPIFQIRKGLSYND